VCYRFRPEARIETPNQGQGQGQGQGQVARHHTFPQQTLPQKPCLPNFSGRLTDSVGQSQQPIPPRPASFGVPPHISALQNPQTFPTVRAMITHYSQTPLLLIDAKNPCQQNQCRLLEPSGYHLT
ncbi:hypothetical protein CRUP_020020, partial [Coryphaenoides rupestris]